MRLWTAVDGRSKDYIAQAKPNGYQSIHTTLRVASVTVELPQSSIDEVMVRDAGEDGDVGPGPTLELQIRTAGEYRDVLARTNSLYPLHEAKSETCQMRRTACFIVVTQECAPVLSNRLRARRDACPGRVRGGGAHRLQGRPAAAAGAAAAILGAALAGAAVGGAVGRLDQLRGGGAGAFQVVPPAEPFRHLSMTLFARTLRSAPLKLCVVSCGVYLLIAARTYELHHVYLTAAMLNAPLRRWRHCVAGNIVQ